MELIDLITELTKKGLSITLEYNQRTERLEGTIQIGSKTGTGTLFESNGAILLTTRYDIIDSVSSYEDIAQVAFRWYDNYKDREPFGTPDAVWLDYFMEKGWIKIETQTVYKTIK